MAISPYSNLKIFWHPEKLKAIREGRITAPIYVRIKPTNRCNHRCFYCSYADAKLKLRSNVNRADQIPWPRLKKAIQDLGKMGVKAVTFSGGGEPLLYPQIKEAFRLILNKGVDLSLITNGQLLKGEIAGLLAKAKWVRVSLDACDAKTFSRMRNVPEEFFNLLTENIANFAKIKDRECELGINFVVNRQNAGMAYQMARFAKALGANHIKYTARITKDLFRYHSQFKDLAVRQIARAKKELEDRQFKVVNKYSDDFRLSMVFKRTYSRCPIMQIVTVIGADSKVYLCHDKAYVPAGHLGSLGKRSFKEIWNSNKAKKIFSTFDPRRNCRHHCVYDERNILLNEAFKCADSQVNFI